MTKNNQPQPFQNQFISPVFFSKALTSRKYIGLVTLGSVAKVALPYREPGDFDRNLVCDYKVNDAGCRKLLETFVGKRNNFGSNETSWSI